MYFEKSSQISITTKVQCFKQKKWKYDTIINKPMKVQYYNKNKFSNMKKIYIHT